MLERRTVRQLWNYIKPPRRVLDVGCASGDTLIAIRKAGNSDIVGLEPNTAAANVARQRGLDVFNGTLEEAKFEREAFSTVIASHTLEHVSRPLKFLTEVWRILIPGGALLLWLPNADSVEAEALGKYWIGYDAPRHLTTFSVETLSRALERSGFRVVDVSHEWIGLEWAWGLRLFVRGRWPLSEPVFSVIHSLIIVLMTPIAVASAVRRKSGRIRVISVKIPPNGTDETRDGRYNVNRPSRYTPK